MLARKNQLIAKSTALSTVDRSMLMQQRTLAIRRQDYAELAEIDAKLATDVPKAPESAKQNTLDLLAKVNERNRKANLEAMRKAELESVERKRRERKLALEKGASGSPGPIDPSARLKITPRTFNSATPTTRFVIALHCSALLIVLKAWNTCCERKRKYEGGGASDEGIWGFV